jgi:adenylate cyclase class IV
MFEVERKYRVRRRDFDTITACLFEWLWPALPALQEDKYLATDDPQLTVRVRSHKTSSGIVYLRTEKRKLRLPGCPNTNQEEEHEIERAEFTSLVRTRQAREFDQPLVVKKTRTEFEGTFEGLAVSVCLDRAMGPSGIKLGHFVELETMAQDAASVPAAHAVLRSLANAILPRCRKREKRGYRTILLDVLAERARAKSKKGKKKSNGKSK